MKEKNEKRAVACIIEFSAFEPDEFFELYTPLRRKTLEGLKNEHRKTQGAAAELAYLAAARSALESGFFGSSNPENNESLTADELKKRFEYFYDKNGRPMLPGAFMSLSHTEGAALAVIAPFPVGADVERERQVSERIAKRIMNASEYREFSLLTADEKNARILECWTAKESFLKLTGEGIAAGFDKLHYDCEKNVVTRKTTGERAFAARFDSRELCVCVCSFAETEPKLLRFLGAQEAAGFIKP